MKIKTKKNTKNKKQKPGSQRVTCLDLTWRNRFRCFERLNVRLLMAFKTYWATSGVSRSIPVTNTVTSPVSKSLTSCAVTLLCRPDLTEGIAVTESGNQNAMGVTGSQGDKSHKTLLNHGRRGGCAYVMENRVKAAIRIAWLPYTYGSGWWIMGFLETK